MKRLSIITLFLVLVLSGIPQLFTGQNINIPWESCYGGSEFEYTYDIIQTNDGYFILSDTESFDGDITFNHGTSDLWVIKIDINGDLIYEKCFGGSKGEGASNLLKITDSTYYIGGATKSNDGDISYNPDPASFNFWIFKFDADGNIIWDKVVGGSRHEMPRDATVTDDNGIVMMGLTNSDDRDVTNYYGFYDIWLIKLNEEGEKEWDFTLGGSSLEEAGAIIQTSDGGYAIAASTDGAGGGNYDTTCNYHGLPNSYQDFWIVKLDSQRNIEWQQCYGGLYDDGAGDIIEVEDGYVVVGSTMSNDGDVSGLNGPPGPNSEYGGDIWVIKIDFDGNLIWQKCLGGLYDDFSRNIFTTSDGGFMVVGRTTSDDGDVEGYHGEGMGIWGDIWFVKLSSEGELQWQYCYGGNGDERIYHGVIQKADYNYVIAIETDTDPWQCGGPMWFDVRVAEISDTLTSLNDKYQENSGFLITAYPNPANNKITFESKLKEHKTKATIRIWNTSGYLMDSFDLNRTLPSITIPVNQWPEGMYYYQLVTGSKVVSDKFLIAR
jgi:hypothetical protein